MATDRSAAGREHNPVFNDNRLKLGTFGTNTKGIGLTQAPEAYLVTWPRTLALAQQADAAGYEALVPVARFKGYIEDAPEHRSHVALDSYTWAAGLAQATRQTAVFATSHVATMHPLLAAKQATTIDHISGGRFALNVVAGWVKEEQEMFGPAIKGHDDRYALAAEWLEVLQRLWTADAEFDFEGRFFQVKRGLSRPKPIQQPFPAIMNAGGSDKGRQFAAKYSDMAFIVIKSQDLDACRAEIAAYKELAFREYGRPLQIWSFAQVVQRATLAEARRYDHYLHVEHGDERALQRVLALQREQVKWMSAAELEAFRYRIMAGVGAYPLVGTADTIASQLIALSGIGLDGMLLSWADYADGMTRFNAGVLPLLEQAGLRRAHVESRRHVSRSMS